MKGYRWRDIRWRNLWLLPILIVSFIVFMIIVMINAAIFEEILLKPHTSLINYEAIGLLTQLLAYVAVIFAFFLINLDLFKSWMKQWWQGIKRMWLWIIAVYLVTVGVMYLFSMVKEYFPTIFTSDTTQNEQIIEQLLSIPQLLPFNFLLIVIAGPIVEEIFFRHILIGELGKKLNFVVMSVISVLLFSAIHLVDFTNWTEIFDYLIIAIPLVFLYMKSGRNLGVAIAFHMLNNFVSFCISMIP